MPTKPIPRRYAPRRQLLRPGPAPPARAGARAPCTPAPPRARASPAPYCCAPFFSMGRSPRPALPLLHTWRRPPVRTAPRLEPGRLAPRFATVCGVEPSSAVQPHLLPHTPARSPVCSSSHPAHPRLTQTPVLLSLSAPRCFLNFLPLLLLHTPLHQTQQQGASWPALQAAARLSSAGATAPLAGPPRDQIQVSGGACACRACSAKLRTRRRYCSGCLLRAERAAGCGRRE